MSWSKKSNLRRSAPTTNNVKRSQPRFKLKLKLQTSSHISIFTASQWRNLTRKRLKVKSNMSRTSIRPRNKL